ELREPGFGGHDGGSGTHVSELPGDLRRATYFRRVTARCAADNVRRMEIMASARETSALNFDSYPQQPHGGVLIDQVVPEAERAAESARALSLPSIRIDLEAAITIEMIATGVLSPIRGF